MFLRRKRRSWFWSPVGALLLGLVMFGAAWIFNGVVSKEPREPKEPSAKAGRKRRWIAGGVERVVNWLTQSSSE